MEKYGVAFSIDGKVYRKKTCPQVVVVENKQRAIEIASYMKANLFRDVVAFENLSQRTQVDWNYIEAHKI